MARRGMALALEGRVEGEAVHLAATSPGSAPTKHLHRKQNLRRKTVSNKVMTSGKGGKDQQKQPDEQWGAKKDTQDIPESSQGNKAHRTQENQAGSSNQARIPCEICGLYNHVTKDCRGLNCEICGPHGHMAYDCKECIPWNNVPKLCATQVEDQSFFFIEEDIDPRMAREKECTVVITITAGQATGKDIERQFVNVHGSETGDGLPEL